MNPNQVEPQQSSTSPQVPLTPSTGDTLVNPKEMTPKQTSLYTQSHGNNVDKVVQTYMKLNKVFFGLGSYIMIGIIGLLIVWRATLPDEDRPFPMRDDTTIEKEYLMKTEIEGISDKDSELHDLKVIVKQGELLLQSNKLISINNLVTYKGFTLPQKSSLQLASSTGELQPSSYFVSRSHTIQDLDNYLKTIIFENYVSTPNLNPVITRNQLLFTKYSFVDYFGIQCLLYPQLGNITLCGKVLDEVIPNFAVYNLSNHYDELLIFAKRVQGTRHQQEFCESMKQYLFVSNDTSSSMKEVMSLCGDTYETIFSEFSSFRTMQDQLTKQSILSNVTTSAVLNSYKLVSVMQDIYHETVKGNNINELRIGSYIDYIRSLLKNPQSIQGFYMDIIARYNNTFLSPILTQNSIATRGEVSAEYRRLLLDLNELNQGSVSKGFTGLNMLVSNSELITQTSSNYTGSIEIDDSTLVERFQESYSFANYIILESKENDDQMVQTVGRLRFATDIGLANNTPLNIVFMYKDQRFYATSIEMSRHPILTLAINPKLAIQPLAISELYDLIIQTQKSVSEIKPSQEVCTAFQGDKTMVSCDPQTVKFLINDISYTFSYTKTQGVNSYSISHQQLDQSAKQAYGTTITLTRDPVEAIMIVLNHRLSNEGNATQNPDSGEVIGGAQEVQLQKNFDELAATIQELKQSNAYYLVDFSLKGYQFTAVYDPASQSILGLGILIEGTTHPIRNIKFSFATNSASDKELFKNDPKSFLLQFDPLTMRRLQL